MKQTMFNTGLAGFIVFEALCIVALLSLVPSTVFAAVGADNVTVPVTLQVGNSFPEFINVTINGGNGIDLTPNATTDVVFEALIRDYNGENDINAVLLRFFDNVASSYSGGIDNNTHYRNTTCNIDTAYGDANEINATCIIPIYYNANNATWNATLIVNDSLNASTTFSQTAIVNTLLALALPDSINYGIVNATDVSDEINVNITNVGNVGLNLTLSGYGGTPGDGWALNCSQGDVQNISIDYQKFNLTASNSGDMSLAQFELNYTNLTSASAVKQFDLPQQTTEGVNDAFNDTYWRVYVPTGVAGNCSGNIVFGAVQAPEL